jgi:hypothetical protein
MGMVGIAALGQGKAALDMETLLFHRQASPSVQENALQLRQPVRRLPEVIQIFPLGCAF